MMSLSKKIFSFSLRDLPVPYQSEVAGKQAEVDSLTTRINEHEARSQDGGAARRQEYQRLEKAIGVLRRDREALQQDLEISTMNPKAVRLEIRRSELQHCCASEPMRGK